MANTILQRIGEFKLCATGGALVDYSSVVSRAGFTIQHNMITIPPVLSTSLETEVAGSIKRTLNVQFHSTTAAASIYGVLLDIIDNDDSLLDWSLKQNDTAISADNPVYSGTASLPMLEGMPDVGSLRQQTIACPITAWNTPDITP